MKKTVIIGATENKSRYAFLAAQMLHENDIEFIPVGIKRGNVLGNEILDLRNKPSIENIDTITLYINAGHQPEWYDYLIKLKPKRIIFNPGTENPDFEKILEENSIEAVEACTLVMLRSNQY